MLLYLFILLILYVCTNSGQDSNFIDPIWTGSNVEFYDIEGARFAIYLEQVSFSEAEILCPSRQGVLLELDDDEVAPFLARALAESAVGYKSLWIGGRLFQGDPPVYKWIKSGDEIEVGDSFPMLTYPYWVGKPFVDKNESYCVVFDRRGHEEPLITDLPCTARRPFICRLPPPDGTRPEVVSPAIVGKDKIFHLYQASLTWGESLSFCREMGFRLATLDNDFDYRLLANKMLRSRPVIENVWISGKYEHGVWRWVSTDQSIPTPSTPTKEPRESDAPPWFHDPIIEDGCLLADRHICNDVVFIEAKCSRKRSILCEEIKEVVMPPTLVQLENSTLWISSYMAIWVEALQMCKQCFPNPKNNMLMFKGEDDFTSKLAELFLGMTVKLQPEIRHVWIGGHLSDSFKENRYYWTTHGMYLDKDPWNEDMLVKQATDNSTKPTTNLIMCVPGSKTNINNTDFQCLNLDREDQKTFFMYGLRCNIKQHFVCDTLAKDVEPLATCPILLHAIDQTKNATKAP